MSIVIVRQIEEMRSIVREWKREGLSVGLVPTMGALHNGHLSLVEQACGQCDRVIVTIFVNPTQFNNPKDLEKYPKTESQDVEMLERFDVNLVFAPSPEEMYPNGFSTNITVGAVSEGLEGEFRPGHFDGVATIVAKLFLQSDADKAFFGEKDFQQLHVIKKFARDLDIGVDVIGCPTIREEDGLAMSSRNVHLSKDERKIAPQMANSLKEAAKSISAGKSIDDAIAEAKANIVDAGFDNVEYLELRTEDDLSPMVRFDRSARLLVAAQLGKTRLIDNCEVRK